MKKFFFSCLAIAALASCAKTEPTFTEVDSEIKIAPVTAVATKTVNGSIDGTVYPTEEEFNIWAYWANKPAGSKFTADETASNAGAYLNNVTFVNKGQYWGGETTYYWPKNGSLRFAAYSPETVPGVSHVLATDTYTVNYTQTSNTANTVDFLLAATSPSYTAQTAAENVSVVFEHALAWITIQVKAANADAAKAFTIKDVIVEDAYTTGTLTAAMTDGIQYGEWSARDTKADYEVVKEKAINVTTEATIVEDNAKGTVVIPQVPTTLTINYTQNAMDGTPELGSQTVNIPLELDDEANNQWEPGKHYIYTVNFDLDEILINPSVVDWEDVVVEDKEFDEAGQIATVKNEEELLAALAKVDGNGNHVVTEIELTDEVVLSKNLAVDYSVAFVGGGFSGPYTVTVTGPVVSFKDVAFANASGNNQTSVYVYNGNKNITFEDCSFTGYNYEAIQYTSKDVEWISIVGCNFNSDKTPARHIHVQPKSDVDADGSGYADDLLVDASIKVVNNVFEGAVKSGYEYVCIHGFHFENMTLSGNAMDADPAANLWISDDLSYTVLRYDGFTNAEVVENASDLISNAAAGDPVAMASDLEVSAPVVVKGGVLEGAGHSITTPEVPANNGVVCPEGTATVQNVTIDGGNKKTADDKSLRAIYITKGGEYTFNNVNTVGTGYAINVNTTQTVTLTVTNSVLEGWTSYGGSTTATFTDVQFTKGTYFDDAESNAYYRPYGTTVLTNCSFEADYTIDLSALAAGATIEFVNCTYGGAALTTANLTDYAGKESVVTVR